MPKEFLYGSDKRVPGYGLILASSTATPEEKKWVSENSVYTHIGSHEESPVSWSFSLAGKSVFLTRSSSSFDYSGRRSFLASHLELSQEETLLYEDGPVYVLSRYHFVPQSSNEIGIERNVWQFLNRFDGCREENSRCGVWQSILSPFNQNGRSFAGATAILILRGNPVYLVYNQNQREEIFPLFRELWSLLPVVYRWKNTFNTYLSNLGTVYSLNGLLKEADQTNQLCQSGNVSFLDLTTGEHNYPAELFDIHNLSGIERYLMTGIVPQAQANYEQTPVFPVQCSTICEEQMGLVQKFQEELQKIKTDLMDETSRVNSELESLKETNTRYRNNAERMRTELSTLERNINEKTNILSGLKSEIEKLQKEQSELEHDLQVLRICSQKKSLYENIRKINEFSEGVLSLIHNLDQDKN